MKVAVINQTIRDMCLEIKAQGRGLKNWQLNTEEELLYEAAVCVIGSQMKFETAVAIADRLRDTYLLLPQRVGFDCVTLESNIANTLSEPLPVFDNNGVTRWIKPRFKNRIASLLTLTISEIYGKSNTIRQLLLRAETAKEARELLVQNVWGFGPKQASLFLRRIGYCADLAVLDVHVLDYLRITRGVTISPSKLGRLQFYEEIEDDFREIAIEFGYSVGCVDLATWLTMRVAKREAYL
ncbi:hypothetical protein ACH518_04685 [Methylomonas sp. HW2-6]|uniref:8-oxoguanine DNA glycosylase n=1 Tax=Methylomonas sp. HW2-6 TaxID=3376687 RepID=UPI004042C67C